MVATQEPGEGARNRSFPRDARLRKHADYQRVYKTGKRQSLPLLTYFFAPRSSGAGALGQHPNQHPANRNTPDQNSSHQDAAACGPRVGLTAGRVLGKAVERNRIKRRVREAVRHAIGELTAPADVILHPRRSVLDAEFALIQRDVTRALRAVQAAMKVSFSASPSSEKETTSNATLPLTHEREPRAKEKELKSALARSSHGR